MKTILVVATLLFSLNVFSHEGGHGNVSEGGKFGGIMAPVIDKAHEEKGHQAHAHTLFKAELVRSESGKLSLYVFDTKMNLLPLTEFSEEVLAKLEVKKKGKFTYVGEFKLKKNGNHYEGQLPKVDYKPFNIDTYFQKGQKKLFVGFSNLD